MGAQSIRHSHVASPKRHLADVTKPVRCKKDGMHTTAAMRRRFAGGGSFVVYNCSTVGWTARPDDPPAPCSGVSSRHFSTVDALAEPAEYFILNPADPVGA